MTITDRIEINPKVLMGKPVIRGTRISVELLLRKLSEGATENDLLDAYPRLKAEGYTSRHWLCCRHCGARGNDYRRAAEKAREALIDALSSR